jgi:altronate hydrolase
MSEKFICGNPRTYARVENMDVNAGRIMTGESTIAEVGREIFDLLLRVAAGEMTKSETLGHREYFIPYKTEDLCVNR